MNVCMCECALSCLALNEVMQKRKQPQNNANVLICTAKLCEYANEWAVKNVLLSSGGVSPMAG